MKTWFLKLEADELDNGISTSLLTDIPVLWLQRCTSNAPVSPRCDQANTVIPVDEVA